MIKIYSVETGSLLGEISENQLEMLQDHLEEESIADQDYYIDDTTIDYLESAGADTVLIGLLRHGLGESEGFDIRWEQ